MPYESRLNPAFAAARQHSQKWPAQFGLIDSGTDEQRIQQGEYALLCSYFYPEASQDDLELATDWATWQFILDDTFNDTYQAARDWRGARSTVSRLTAFMPAGAAQGIPAPASPIERALADLWERTVHRMTPSWRLRFFGSMIKFTECYVWETRNLATQQVPDLIEHIETRRWSSGTLPLLDFLELTMDFELPGLLVQTRPISVMTMAITDAIMNVNDIFSFHKERAHADIHNNVYIFQTLLGCGPASAVEFVNKMATSRICLCERVIADELTPMLDDYHAAQRTRDGMLRWARLITLWLPGNLEWHRASGRYRHAELWRPDAR